MRNIAFFDFDGTITSRDSLILFIYYAVGGWRMAIGLAFLSPVLLAYKLKLIPNDVAKQQVLSHFFKGVDEKQFAKLAEGFSLQRIDAVLRPKAMEQIVWHKKQGHTVVVVSASIEHWLKPWCDNNELDLIATQLEVHNGVVTGRLQSPNCYGPEKVVRIQQVYDLDNYQHIYAYGDSRGDRELLAIAHTTGFRAF